MGIPLKNPLVASSSSLSKKKDNILKMEDVGLSAVVLYSLFEEEITHESLALNHFLTRGTESYPEALSYFPDLDNYNTGPDNYLNLIRWAKEKVEIPIIGSLNGISTGGWIQYARMIQEAGADALELNLYFIPTDDSLQGAQVENAYIKLVEDIRAEISIPLAVKLSPFFSSLPDISNKMVDSGADGLVLFNRFYQPNINLETLSVEPHLELSTSADLLLPLRWTAILYQRVHIDFALSSGIHTAEDIAKSILAGANVAMSASALIREGIGKAQSLLKEMEIWMNDHGYEEIKDFQGILSQKSIKNPAAYERANYMKALTLFDEKS